MSIKAEQITAYVKGAPDNQLGDCPFCHRVMLVAEEKKVPYNREYILFDNKPQWLVDLNGGTVPAVKQGEKMYNDSASIVDFFESAFPEPKVKPDSSQAEIGSKFFPAFIQFGSSKADNEAETKKNFEQQLSEIDQQLGNTSGPFFGGSRLNDIDAQLAPKLLRHAVTALKHYKKYEFLNNYPNIKKYYDAVSASQPWKDTFYTDEVVIEGWKPKFGSG